MRIAAELASIAQSGSQSQPQNYYVVEALIVGIAETTEDSAVFEAIIVIETYFIR